MPAITLGLAEVEVRLRALCRRLNSVNAQHTAYLGASVVLLVVTALIILGLRASASTFRMVAWGGAVLAAAAVAVSVVFVRRQWLDIEATARLVDRRARLTDRLATLVDLRMRPRPSRLAPLLIAQTLSLGARWHAQQIAPRRVPRSVFLFVAALLLLASTAFISREPPVPAPPAMAAGTGQVPSVSTSGSLEAPPLGGRDSTSEQMGGSTTLQASARSDSGAAPGGREPSKSDATSPDGGLELGGGRPIEQPDTFLSALPDRLQEAIRRAFHAEAMDHPRDVAMRHQPDTSGAEGRQGDGRGEHDTQPRDPSHGGNRTSEKGTQKASGAPGKQPGQSKGEQSAQRQDADAANQNFEGASPQAGDGSSPGGLLNPKAAAPVAGQDGPKTFKLMITSFLRTAEQKGNQTRQGGKHGSDTTSAGTGTGAQTAPSDRQLNDDALRKAEIPPEYEDIVRRVYSQRVDQ